MLWLSYNIPVQEAASAAMGNQTTFKRQKINGGTLQNRTVCKKETAHQGARCFAAAKVPVPSLVQLDGWILLYQQLSSPLSSRKRCSHMCLPPPP